MAHTRVPQPFTLDEDDVLDYESGRAASSELNRRRVDARKQLQAATEKRIELETLYRKARARAHVEGIEGKDAEARKDALNDKVNAEWQARENQQAVVDMWKERLEEIDGQRASLHRLIEWSAQLDPAVAEVWAQRREQRDQLKAA